MGKETMMWKIRENGHVQAKERDLGQILPKKEPCQLLDPRVPAPRTEEIHFYC